MEVVVWMVTRIVAFACGVAIVVALAGCESPPETVEQPLIEQAAPDTEEAGEHEMADHEFAVQKSDDQWREELTEEQYRVLRQAGTERAFDNEYWDNKARGVYHCAGCGNELFRSEDKFKSGTGWPSFTRPIDEGAVLEREDASHGMRRTEIVCADCGGHLGHVFTDGPEPTGLRYCMNSVAMDFKSAGEGEEASR